MIALKSMVTNDFLKIEKDLENKQKTSEYILKEMGDLVDKVDFKIYAFPDIVNLEARLSEIKKILKNSKNETLEIEAETIEKKLSGFKLTKNHYLILCIEQLLKIAESNEWGLSKKDGSIFLFDGSYHKEINKESFQYFLGNVALKMGVEKFKCKIHTFKDELYKQFLAESYLETPEPKKDNVLINLNNGTMEITPFGKKLRPFRREDFLTHKLTFDYDKEAKAPMFRKYLNDVLPDLKKQKVLAEFMGYVFTKGLKKEKALVLLGTGANGKSVFFEIICALLGRENISSYAIESLTTDANYSRAKISNKLVNYASEMNGRLDANMFKQLVSIEPIQARLPYGEPFMITDYAKLIFNCNELPKETEHTHAFFRRFLILNFDVTISEHKQDKELHTKIINNELSGVFNWVLEGLDNLLLQKDFTECEAIDNARLDYEKTTDSAMLFVEEMDYKKSIDNYTFIKILYEEYKTFCFDDGFRALNKHNFMKRLSHHKFMIKRISEGNVCYITKQ